MPPDIFKERDTMMLNMSLFTMAKSVRYMIDR